MTDLKQEIANGAGMRLERPRFPRTLRALDAAGRALEKVGAVRLSLDEESLCAGARRKTGLSDFGDERFRLGLREQLEGQRVLEKWPFVSRLAMRFLVRRSLCNRLLIEQQIAEHPEIAEQAIRRPLMVVGFGRTGTTLLQSLLAQDPGSRTLLVWEAASPARPGPDRGPDEDPRLRRAERISRLVKFAIPRLSALHTYDPQGPQECGLLFRNAFYRPDFGKSPRQWLRELTAEWAEWAYGQYKRQLQLLQWQRPAPDHWLLKWPLHCVGLEALVKTFPDAAIVQTHRDPLQVIPSACQVATLLTFYLNDERWRQMPRELMCFIADVFRAGIEGKKRVPEGRVLDVHYRQLVADPIGTVRQIYDHFGYRYTDEFERRARRWLEEHPAPKRSKKFHDLEQFGLTRADVETAFAFYRQQYGVEPT